MCYRSDETKFIAEEGVEDWRLHNLRSINPQAHMGELGEELGLGQATRHEVIVSDAPQYSVVYFAIPRWELVLPSGVTVKDWLNERMARSRSKFDEYK